MSEAVAVAIIGAINTSLGSGARAYDSDEIPGLNGNSGTIPARYVEVVVARRYLQPYRADRAPSFVGYRVATRSVAMNITDARNLRRLTTLALENKTITVSGEALTPMAFETEDPIEPDEDRYSGLTYWTTTH